MEGLHENDMYEADGGRTQSSGRNVWMSAFHMAGVGSLMGVFIRLILICSTCQYKMNINRDNHIIINGF